MHIKNRRKILREALPSKKLLVFFVHDFVWPRQPQNLHFFVTIFKKGNVHTVLWSSFLIEHHCHSINFAPKDTFIKDEILDCANDDNDYPENY